MKKKMLHTFGAVAAAVIMLASCGNPSTETQATSAAGTAGAGTTAVQTEAAGTAEGKDSVIVTMPTTSEPESGFDPAYGWGAGEHVHEPLIQSTLTVTTKDLKIEKDLATD